MWVHRQRSSTCTNLPQCYKAMEVGCQAQCLFAVHSCSTHLQDLRPCLAAHPQGCDGEKQDNTLSSVIAAVILLIVAVILCRMSQEVTRRWCLTKATESGRV